MAVEHAPATLFNRRDDERRGDHGRGDRDD
jgi:hypothetical protein